MRAPIKTFISVDPSKSHTGITVWRVQENGHLELLYQGVINNPTLDGPFDVKPYRRIIAGVRATIEQYKPDILFVEKMFQSKMPAISEMLFIAAFCVRMVAEECSVPFRVIPVRGKEGWNYFHIGPTYSKLKGGLCKTVSRARIESGLGFKFKNEHISDSAAIGLAGYHLETGIDYRDVMGLEKPDFDVVPEKKPTKRKAAKPKE